MIKLASRVVTATVALLAAAPASSQDEAQFGTVHFQTSCNEVAQRRFDRGMRYQHSFWYRPAREIFDDTLKADPDCTIAHWGVALALLLNPHFPAPKENMQQGLAALEKAKAMGAKTQRERDYVDALLVLYTDYDKVPFGQRVQGYLKAMEALAARYPDDDEAQIAYAITLNVAAPLNDKTYANQLKGVAILEPIFLRQPSHPGVAHYLIHLYDYPPIAEKGLAAAKRYAEIAPAAPHAQHMPSHIFTRVGYWKESAETNGKSARAAKEGKEPNDQLHAMDYQVYAYLQMAQDGQARATVEEMVAVSGFNPAVRTGPFAVAASQARYMLERGDWKGAAALEVQASRFAYVDAMTHFARAVGAARSGSPAAAKPDLVRLVELRDRLRDDKDVYWAEQVDIQWQVANAWLAHAEGRHDEALRILSAAADTEDRTEKSIVTPGPLVPARELYGAMLMERGMMKDALIAFEGTLAKEPNRLGATIGAAKAAEKAGDPMKAKQHYAKVVTLTDGVQTSRTEIADARAFVKNN